MRRKLFASSLLSALACLGNQGFSQVVSPQSRVGQVIDNTRNAVGNSLQQGADQIRGTTNTNSQANAQTNADLSGQSIQSQSTAQLQGNVGSSGVNTQAGQSVQAGLNGQTRINQQNAQGSLQTNAGLQNGQYGANGQTHLNGTVQQNGYVQGQYPQGQGTSNWQAGGNSQMAAGSSVFQNSGWMSNNMQPSGQVYMLRHDASGREFICVNGSPVYFDSPHMNQTNGAMNQNGQSAGMQQNQRRAGYGSHDHLQPNQNQQSGVQDSVSPSLDSQNSITPPALPNNNTGTSPDATPNGANADTSVKTNADANVNTNADANVKSNSGVNVNADANAKVLPDGK